MMTLDDLRRESENYNNALNPYFNKHITFTYLTDKGGTKTISDTVAVYENNNEHIAFLTAAEAAPLYGATSVTVWYNGCEYPATVRRHRNGDIDLSFTPDRA